jgi:molybdopterin converting factor small subunit
MEELQSTELLDREILEDARKKAYRILKTADDTIKSKAAELEKNLGATVAKLEEKYARQGGLAADEIMARLPIDKQRTKAKKIEELLHSAVEAWYAGLSRSRVLELLKNELIKRIAASDKDSVEGAICARIHKIEKKEAEEILKTVLPGKSFAVEEIHSAAPYPEIIIETPKARIYASINKTVDFLLGEQRAELLEALLGETDVMGAEQC